jgi:hypothetical protein
MVKAVLLMRRGGQPNVGNRGLGSVRGAREGQSVSKSESRVDGEVEVSRVGKREEGNIRGGGGLRGRLCSRYQDLSEGNITPRGGGGQVINK